MDPNHVKNLRLTAGMTQLQMAALAGVAPPTWRSYELRPLGGVSPQKQALCDAAIAAVSRRLVERVA